MRPDLHQRRRPFTFRGVPARLIQSLRAERTWSRSLPSGKISFFLPLQYSILINGGLPTQVSTRGQRDGIVLSPVGLYLSSDNEPVVPSAEGPCRRD